MGHTPLPWKCGKDSDCPYGEWEILWGDHPTVIAHTANSVTGPDSLDSRGNAEFIIRACNSHYDLLAACETALDQIGDPLVFLMVKQAIAKAKSE